MKLSGALVMSSRSSADLLIKDPPLPQHPSDLALARDAQLAPGRVEMIASGRNADAHCARDLLRGVALSGELGCLELAWREIVEWRFCVGHIALSVGWHAVRRKHRLSVIGRDAVWIRMAPRPEPRSGTRAEPGAGGRRRDREARRLDPPGILADRELKRKG